MHRKNLPVGVAQEIAPDPACFGPLSLRCWPIFDGIEIGCTAQDVVILELIHREIFWHPFDRYIAAGTEKTRYSKQSRNMLLIVPAIELGLEFRIDIGPPINSPVPRVLAIAVSSVSEARRMCRNVSRNRARVMWRLKEVLAAKPGEILYMTELCAEVRASYWTLRDCCSEYLGMSPKRYLWLRRMHLARRALKNADAERTTVTKIASDYGFWEFGRFSVAYRSLFGESPSTALRRPLDDSGA